VPDYVVSFSFRPCIDVLLIVNEFAYMIYWFCDSSWADIDW